MSRGNNKRTNQQLIKQNYLGSYLKSGSLQNLEMESIVSKSANYYPSMNQESLMSVQQKMIRLNIINKQNESQRISMITSINCPISQLKRKIQAQYYQLNSKSLLIKLIQDSRGFVFSNNSIIGDHVQPNDTIYIVVHNQKQGANMNLPSNLTDIFLTLRYVTKSVVKKLSEVRKSLSLREVLSQLIPFGFWYSNSDIITEFLKLMNDMLTKQQLLLLQKGAGEILDNLIVKLISFWLLQIPNAAQIYPDVYQQVLLFIQRLTLSNYYADLFRNSKLTKKITQMSKNNLKSQLTKICLNILRNVSGRNRNLTAPNKLKLDHNQIEFQDQNYDTYSLEQALDMLEDNQQQMNRMRALEVFSNVKNKLCIECTVRFDYYWKLIHGLLNIKTVRQKKQLKYFAVIIQEIIKNTSASRAAQLLDKNILKKIHDFLLESPVQLHKPAIRYTSNILNLSAKSGQVNIKKICQLFSTPYEQFLIVICEAVEKSNQFHTAKGKGFTLVYINNIKDFIRMSLKSSNPLVSRPLLRVLSNLSLDQQCRYQILNLKGIQIFIKLLQTNRQNIQIQRVCAKGLLNLAISSRDIRVRVLAQMTHVIQLYYKRELDSIASGYVQTILKTAKV